MDPFLWMQQNPDSVLAFTTGLFASLWLVALATRKRPKRKYETVRTETPATIITEREL